MVKALKASKVNVIRKFRNPLLETLTILPFILISSQPAASAGGQNVAPAEAQLNQGNAMRRINRARDAIVSIKLGVVVATAT